jgi:hypothetical protein
LQSDQEHAILTCALKCTQPRQTCNTPFLEVAW